MRWNWLVFVGIVFPWLDMPDLTHAQQTRSQQTGWLAGFANVDITPQEPLRLSGYGNRDQPFAGVDESLHIRAFALRQGADGPVHVLLSVDTIGFPGALTKEIHEHVEAQHGIDRARFAICCTHSHAAPHITQGLSNLFAAPLTPAEQAAGDRYRDFVMKQALQSVQLAVTDLKPARLYHGVGEAGFAQNRRVIKNGMWTGFGVNPDGPVDHSLPCLRITDETGKNIRGIVFNYACHCTTFGGDYNRVNGDWAGYAARYLEESHANAVALSTIGCGADANPHRDPATAFQLAQAQGKEIAEEITRLVHEPLTEISAPADTRLESSFGYAGLPIDRPTTDQLKAQLKSERPQERFHAEYMLDLQARMGRLPETYPMPIQSWRIGDQFAMVFLGGEVCVDYGLRIKREFSSSATFPDTTTLKLPVWVNAYANDVFGYVAPERMRAEGGYEVDSSMIYYLQPGRWSTGTEEVILRRVHELVENRNQSRPMSALETLETFRLADGLTIDLIASEPLLADPVNFAVGPDGKLWVVEMSDYPRGEKSRASKVGNPGQPTPWAGPPAGQIKCLTDENGDGVYDKAQVFLDTLSFPTGVFPWRDGVLVCAAPDVFFAKDTDHDGVADHREVLYTGFAEANPQHRTNGFVWGLDGWLYLAGGASSNDITCVKTGEKVNVSGRDIRIHPDSGRLEAVSGRSQYGRCRDDFGNWFGNTNSEPLFHFAIEDRDLKRNPFVSSPSARVFLTEYAAPIFPTSRTVDRFNDLFALDRFTSACGPQVIRNPVISVATTAHDPTSILICEPVHNLVSRVIVQRDGVTFQGQRVAEEAASEFLSSSDQWVRPVRVMNAPDGTLWVCDMYRQVIEHPQWIPEAWQSQLDLYAGSDRGRIYRIRRKDQTPEPIRDLSRLSTAQLIQNLDSPNAWQRDICQQLLVERGDASSQIASQLAELTRPGHAAAVRVQAWWTLVAWQAESLAVEQMLEDADPRVVANGIRGWRRNSLDTLNWQLVQPLQANRDLGVRYALALAAEPLPVDKKLNLLSDLAKTDSADPWMRAAILSSCQGVAADVLAAVLQDTHDSPDRRQLVEGLINTALGSDVDKGLEDVVRLMTREPESHASWKLDGALACVDALSRRNLTLAQVIDRSSPERRKVLNRLDPLFQYAGTLVEQAASGNVASVESAAAAILLLGRVDATPSPRDLELLQFFLGPQVEPTLRLSAIEGLARLDRHDILLSQFREFSPVVRSQVLTLLLSRKSGTSTLLEQLESGTITSQDLDAATRQTLLSLRDSGLRTRAERLLAAGSTGPRGDVVNSYAAKIQDQELKGDSERGRQGFGKRCATCHKVGDQGTDLGPKLSALQNKSIDFLLTAMLDPSQAVEPKFTGYVIETSDGRVHSGLILDENATSLMLAAADGKQSSILRRDITEMISSGKSFMPEGLEKDVTPQEALDIIQFLQQSQ